MNFYIEKDNNIDKEFADLFENDERIEYRISEGDIELVSKGGFMAYPKGYLTNKGRIAAYVKAGVFANGASSINSDIIFEFDEKEKNKVLVISENYPRLNEMITVTNYLSILDVLKRNKDIRIMAHDNVIINKTILASVKVYNDSIILKSGNHQIKIQYEFVKDIQYNAECQTLTINGMFNLYFENFTNVIELMHFTKEQYKELCSYYEYYILKGSRIKHIDITSKYIRVKSEKIFPFKHKQIIKSNLILNRTGDYINVIDEDDGSLVDTVSIRNLKIIIKKEICFIKVKGSYISIFDRIQIISEFNKDTLSLEFINVSGIKYLLSKEKLITREVFNPLKSLGEIGPATAIINRKHAALYMLGSSILHSSKIEDKINSSLYEGELIKDYYNNIEELGQNVLIINIDGNEHCVEVLLNEKSINLFFSSSEYIKLNYNNDISSIELLSINNDFNTVDICSKKYVNLKIEIHSKQYFNIIANLVVAKTQFNNVNEAFYSWAKSNRDIMVFYYFGLGSELKGYIEKSMKGKEDISQLSKSEKIDILNVMYDVLKQYKAALTEFSAYFSKELYEEHCNDNSLEFKRKFDSLQSEMHGISNYMIRHINDCIGNLNNLVNFIYPELDIRKKCETINKNQGYVRTAVYSSLYVLTGSLSLLAFVGLNSTSIFDSDKRTKIIDEVEEEKLNIFLGNAIGEFNNLMDRLMPKYIEDINKSAINFAKQIERNYSEQDMMFLRDCFINNTIFLKSQINPYVVKSKEYLVDYIIEKAESYNTNYLSNNKNEVKRISRSQYYSEIGGK